MAAAGGWGGSQLGARPSAHVLEARLAPPRRIMSAMWSAAYSAGASATSTIAITKLENVNPLLTNRDDEVAPIAEAAQYDIYCWAQDDALDTRRAGRGGSGGVNFAAPWRHARPRKARALGLSFFGVHVCRLVNSWAGHVARAPPESAGEPCCRRHPLETSPLVAHVP